MVHVYVCVVVLLHIKHLTEVHIIITLPLPLTLPPSPPIVNALSPLWHHCQYLQFNQHANGAASYECIGQIHSIDTDDRRGHVGHGG